MEGRVFGDFEVIKKIGQGSFGEIFLGKNKNDGTSVAIKIEPKKSPKKVLNNDITFLTKAKDQKYIPKFYASGSDDDYTWLAMEYLGPSLEHIINKLPNKKLSKKCALTMAKYILYAIEAVHELSYIHRDIKPGNVLLRHSREAPIALIDYGLSKVYYDERAKMHLPPKPHCGFFGSLLYASPNTHMRRDLARRDDMFSWFYVLADLLTDNLPWRDNKNPQEVLNIKAKYDVAPLIEMVPQIEEIYKQIINMQYVSKPDYEGFRKLLNEAIAACPDGNEFDWHPDLFNMDAAPEV